MFFVIKSLLQVYVSNIFNVIYVIQKYCDRSITDATEKIIGK